MAEWFQVFDDDDALSTAKARARQTVVVFAVGSGLLVAVAPLTTVVWPHTAVPVALGCGLLLTALALWTLRRLHRLHRTLWRVEISVGHVVGYDAGGRRVSLTWSALDRLDVRSEGLLFSGRGEGGRRVRLVVARAMPRFTVLGHRAVEYAEAFGCPLWVEGRPLERLDLTALYPVLREGSAPTV